MKHYKLVIAIILIIGNTFGCANKKLPPKTDKALRETMSTGNIVDRKNALYLLGKDKTNKDAFEIVTLEFTINRTINIVHDAVPLLYELDSARAELFLSHQLLYGNKQMSILRGLSNINSDRVLEIIKGFKPRTRREEAVIAYIKCLHKVEYQNNINILLSFINKDIYKSNAEGQEVCGDAIVYVGDLKDKRAVKHLYDALKWVDGIYVEQTKEAINSISGNSEK